MPRHIPRLHRGPLAPHLMVALVCVVGLSGAPAKAQSGLPANCGALNNHYGPFDYRTDKDKLGIVERAHFTSAVEAGSRGNTTMLAGPDLHYTLTAFPNHHRALLAMVRYGEKMQSPQPKGAEYSVECYFDRALRFRVDDVVARMLYAQYLIKNKRDKDAAAQLTVAQNYAKDSAFAQYYLGMLYFDLKDYDRAQLQAHKAEEMGYDASELRGLLKQAGHWKDPAPMASPEVAASASPPPAQPKP